MAERREYQGAAVVTKLSTDITNSVLALTLVANTGWPTGAVGPFTLVIDPGTTKEEKIRCTARSGSAITIAAGGRGADNTTAVAHNANAVIKHVLGAYDIDLVNRHAADTTQDDHTQYVHNTVTRTITANHIFSNAPVFSGAPHFNGNPIFAGTPHFTGTPTFDNMGLTADITVLDTTTTSTSGVSAKPARADHKHGLNLAALRDYFTPAGVIAPYAGTSAPAGWAICDGGLLSRTTYAALFDIIGTIYGAGDGVTTFNKPNLVGRVVVGVGDISHSSVAGTGGALTQALAPTNMPAHTHDMSHGHGTSDPGHLHGPGGSGGATGFVFAPGGAQQNGLTASTAGGGFNQNAGVSFTGISTATTGVSVNALSASTGSQGAGTAFSVEQPWIALNYIIKVA